MFPLKNLAHKELRWTHIVAVYMYVYVMSSFWILVID